MGVDYSNVKNFYKQYISPINGSGATATTQNANRVYLVQIEIPINCTLKAICSTNGAIVAGNFVLGLYTMGGANTPLGGSLVVQTVSTAMAGTNLCQEIAVTDTSIASGTYWGAFVTDSATATFYRAVAPASPYNNAYFDNGSLVLPSTCPAVTFAVGGFPVSIVKIQA